LGPRLEKKVGLPEHMSACALAGVCFILDFDGRRMTHLMHAYIQEQTSSIHWPAQL
jgi:hypothetical protein